MNYFYFSLLVLSYHCAFTNRYNLSKKIRQNKESYSSLNVHLFSKGNSKYYYVDLFIGEGMTKQTFLLDNSSSITTSVCNPFSKITGEHLNNYYTADMSSLIPCEKEECITLEGACNNNLNCIFSSSNGEGYKVTGLYSKQIVRTKENQSIEEGIEMFMGCTLEEENILYYQKADGVLGLGNSNNNIINHLYNKGKIPQKVFSLCLSPNGGHFSIGEINSSIHIDNSINYFQIKSQNFYSISFTDVIINENKFDSHQYPALFDSGTTNTYFPYLLYQFILDKFNSSVSNTAEKIKKDDIYGYCIEYDSLDFLNNAVNSIWPDITCSIEKYTYTWKAKDYSYIIVDSSKDKYQACLGFSETKEEKIILGTTWMYGYDIIFVIDKNKIGFAKSNCDKDSNIILKSKESGINERSREDYNELKNIRTQKGKDSRQGEELSNIKVAHLLFTLIIAILITIIICLIIMIYQLIFKQKVFCFSIRTKNEYTKSIEVELERSSSVPESNYKTINS